MTAAETVAYEMGKADAETNQPLKAPRKATAAAYTAGYRAAMAEKGAAALGAAKVQCERCGYSNKASAAYCWYCHCG